MSLSSLREGLEYTLREEGAQHAIEKTGEVIRRKLGLYAVDVVKHVERGVYQFLLRGLAAVEVLVFAVRLYVK